MNGEHGLRLPTQIAFELSGDLSHEALERQLSDQKLSRLLILSNFSERNRSRSEAMWLLNALVSDIGRLTGRLLGQLLPGSFRSRVLPCGLFRSCHRLFDFSI